MNRIMNFSVKKLFLIMISLMIVSLSCFSQEAVTKANELLNRSLILNENAKAYSYAQFIIKYFAGEEFPEEQEASVIAAVEAYSKDLEKEKQWDALMKLEEDLKIAPSSIRVAASPSIQGARNYFAEQERMRLMEEQQKKIKEEEEKKLIEQLKKQEAEKALKKEKDAETQKILNIIENNRKADLEKEKIRAEELKAVQEKQLDLEKEKQKADIAYREDLLKMVQLSNSTNEAREENYNETIKSVSKNNQAIFFGMFIFIFVFLAVIIFMVVLAFKQSKNNQEQLKNTIFTMQAMRIAQPVDVLPLPLQVGNSSSTMLLENNTQTSVSSLMNQQEQQDAIKNLIISCKEYGEQIDRATGRKNVTGLVAELVYKISKYLGYSEQQSILYYGAAMVYDIGFLNIDSAILKSETLSNEQFELLKTHTTIGMNMVFFVDEANRELFKDAAGKHHENLDGTGYPQGLKGDQIPYIARVIHVAESYIALISQRNYKEIFDRNAAIQELKNSKKQYDFKILEALDAIV